MPREITDEYGNTIVIPDPIINLQGDEAFKTTTFGGPGFGGEDTGDYDEYGWLQDFINIFRPYVADQDTDDIDRVFRQEQAQEFQDLLERIYAGEATWRDLNKEDYDFLNDIPEFSDYFDGVYDQAQYNGMLNDWQTVAKSDDLQAVEDFINEYSSAGIADNFLVQADLASKGSAVSVLTGTVDNAVWEQAIRDAAIGDGIFGAEIDFEDLPGYGGIWEGIVRHIKVIGRGLQLPIPDWLPLPGIFELPTIGEIFDTITGPWKEASRQILNDCMAGDDGVVGPNPETGVNDDKQASTCLEDQSILDVLAQGAENAVGQVTDATIGKVTEITDKITSCAGIEKDEEGNVVGYDPELTKQCAQGVIDTIKDIFGEGAVDPTASGGIPDWIKGIIIGGTYGGAVIKEIEGIFDSDLDGDGTVGLTPEPVECGEGEADFGNGCEAVCEYDSNIPASSDQCVAPWQDDGPTAEQCREQNRSHVPGNAATETASTCGECLSGFEEVEGQCQEKEDPIENQGPTAQECADQNRDFNEATDVADSSCGPCLEGFEEDSAGNCVATPTATCEDPNSSTFGQQGECGPCKSGFEKGEDGTCVEVIVDPTCEDPNAVNYGEIGECGECKQGFEKGSDGVCIESTPEATCEDPNAVNYGEVGECGECKEGYAKNSAGLCEQQNTGFDCNQPRPDGGFAAQSWDRYCADTHCLDGSTKDNPEGTNCREYVAPVTCEDQNAVNYGEAGDCGACKEGFEKGADGLCVASVTECANGATLESNCEECPAGYQFNFEGNCQPVTGTVNCRDFNQETNEDGTCGPCLPGYVKDTSQPDEPCVPAGDPCPAGYEIDPATQLCTPVTCPEGESFCPETGQCETPENCPSTTTEEEGGGSLFGGGFGGGGANLFEPYSFAVSADPTLLGSKQFPITDFLAGVFTNSTGGKA